jgi:hypothetical protein
VVLNNQIPSDAGWNSDMTQIQNLIQVVTNSFNPTTGGQPRTGYKIDGGDGTVNAALIAPPFGSQWGGGNGRNSYYIPRIPASLWAWIIPSTLDQWFRAEVQSSRALAHAGR